MISIRKMALIVIVVVVIVARTNCAIMCSLFNLYVRSAKC